MEKMQSCVTITFDSFQNVQTYELKITNYKNIRTPLLNTNGFDSILFQGKLGWPIEKLQTEEL